MANYIELVEKYLPVLDEQYRAESRSAILDYPAEWIQETRDAKKFKIARMRVDGMGNYSRQKGFVKGSADLTWEEHEFKYDRGRAIQVDHMDNAETFGMAFGRLVGTFQRQELTPEVDATRFSIYAQAAGTKVHFTVTSGAILKLVDQLDAQMDNDEVPEEGRILFAEPGVFSMMINDPQLVKHINVVDNYDKAINKKIYMYDNHPLVKVPKKRFLTKITLLDGETAGQERGGYIPADDAENIGLMMISTTSVVQISKRAIARVWAPNRELAAGTDGVNPDADAWKFDYRLYHDAFVLEEKVAGIACAVISGDNASGLNNTETVAGSYDSSTGVFTDGNTYNIDLEGSTLKVTGTIPYHAADATLGLEAGNRLDVKFVNAGITSKSQLPDGVIGKTLKSDGTWQEYTKDAFESDGSLILCANVNNLRVGIVEIKWVAGETITYTVNTLGAKLASE